METKDIIDKLILACGLKEKYTSSDYKKAGLDNISSAEKASVLDVMLQEKEHKANGRIING